MSVVGDEGDSGVHIAEASTGREVKGSIPKMVLSYVRRVMGEEAVERVLAESARAAGADAKPGGLLEPASWTSPAYAIAIAEAAARVCGDTEIGRRAGEELMRVQRERGTIDFVRSVGSVAAALELAANVGTKMSAGRVIEVEATGEDWATITATYTDSSYAHPLFCGQAAGYYGLVPEVFGFTGVIAEPECMSRGDSRCVYRLRWSATESDKPLEEVAIAASRERANGLIERFEQLHSLATEMAAAEGVDSLLARIADGAGLAIDAPRYLLAVRMTEGGRLRIQHRGFADDRVERYAKRLLAGELVEHAGCLIADVSSGGRMYGRVVAMYPQGSSATDVDHRLLRAYARHAAAALNSVASLEGARRDRDTAEAMLKLAQGLAEVGTRSDVASRLAAAVPAVAACDTAGVWLWNSADECLCLEARSSHSERVGREVRGSIQHSEMPGLRALVANPVPMIVNLATAAPTLRKLILADGLVRAAIVPIMARGEFLGVISAGFRTGPADDKLDTNEDLLVRLGGLADQAATAMDNADLMTRVREEALHDSLTGLANRRMMESRAEHALRQPAAPSQVSLLFVDLDRFKNINDTLGHEAGDELIQQAADRLRGCVRASDTLARLGGDEFVVMLTGTSCDNDANAAAARMLDAFKPPFHLRGHDVFVTCSIGIAHAPRHGLDYTTLLRHADAAMYSAKHSGRGVAAVYEQTESSSGPTRLELESELHTAAERGQFHLLYQPQVDLETGAIVGVEALVRWDHPTLGRLSPDRFLPVAEEAGLMAGIDEWVRDEAFAQARRWLDQGIDLRMAVNISTGLLLDDGLAARVASDLATHRLDPSRVELEVTDRVVLDEDDFPGRLLPLAELGVRLAIDDFGTGTSVLGRLHRCPIDTMKLDRSFVGTIDRADAPAPIVRALVAMAKALDIDVVAEGVETEAQAEFLRAAGGVLAQGFLFSRPVEACEIEHLVRDHERRRFSGAQPRNNCNEPPTGSSREQFACRASDYRPRSASA